MIKIQVQLLLETLKRLKKKAARFIATVCAEEHTGLVESMSDLTRIQPEDNVNAQINNLQLTTNAAEGRNILECVHRTDVTVSW